MLIAAPNSIEAALIARRLTRWGAAVTLADASTAAGRNGEAALGYCADRSCDRRRRRRSSFARTIGDFIARRIVLITPSERQGLAALKAAGFTGYLVKPVRAASLAARLASNDGSFDTPAGGRRPKPTGASRHPATAPKPQHRSTC